MHPLRRLNHKLVQAKILECKMYQHIPVVGRLWARAERTLRANPKLYVRQFWATMFMGALLYAIGKLVESMFKVYAEPIHTEPVPEDVDINDLISGIYGS